MENSSMGNFTSLDKNTECNTPALKTVLHSTDTYIQRCSPAVPARSVIIRQSLYLHNAFARLYSNETRERRNRVRGKIK